MPTAPAPRLSKTKYIAGLQCPKLLWWQVHEPDAPELMPDASLQYRFNRGNEVGRLARSYVPRGVSIDVPYHEREYGISKTAKALRDGASVLYEAVFEHDGVRIRVDILERTRGGWNLIEVKSSTSVKPEHLSDVAIQAYVLRGVGIKVRRAEVMHLNRECRYPDLSNLFVRENVTDAVNTLIDNVPRTIRDLKRVLRGTVPNVAIGERCHEPYACPFLSRCWPEPPRHSLETLYRIRKGQRESYESQGYQTILDIPDDEVLTEIQERQRRAIRRNRLVVEAGLSGVLDRLEPPFAYLDFETVAPPIPLWNGCRPYDQVPVQLSVHRKLAGGRLTHHEWLAEGSGDPRETLARRLIDFTEGARTILAYNAPFEIRCIQELRQHLPRLDRKLEVVERKLEDLLPVVRDHVYHPRFAGSFSLKKVAPQLAPGISYDELQVAGGERASEILYDLLLNCDGMKAADMKRMRQDLLRYCRMDSEALVKMHAKLMQLASRK